MRNAPQRFTMTQTNPRSTKSRPRTAQVHRREDHGREKDTVLHRRRRHSWASAILLDGIVTYDILCTNPNGQEQRKALRVKFADAAFASMVTWWSAIFNKGISIPVP